MAAPAPPVPLVTVEPVVTVQLCSDTAKPDRCIGMILHGGSPAIAHRLLTGHWWESQPLPVCSPQGSAPLEGGMGPKVPLTKSICFCFEKKWRAGLEPLLLLLSWENPKKILLFLPKRKTPLPAWPLDIGRIWSQPWFIFHLCSFPEHPVTSIIREAESRQTLHISRVSANTENIPGSAPLPQCLWTLLEDVALEKLIFTCMASYFTQHKHSVCVSCFSNTIITKKQRLSQLFKHHRAFLHI